MKYLRSALNDADVNVYAAMSKITTNFCVKKGGGGADIGNLCNYVKDSFKREGSGGESIIFFF